MNRLTVHGSTKVGSVSKNNKPVLAPSPNIVARKSTCTASPVGQPASTRSSAAPSSSTPPRSSPIRRPPATTSPDVKKRSTTASQEDQPAKTRPSPTPSSATGNPIGTASHGGQPAQNRPSPAPNSAADKPRVMARPGGKPASTNSPADQKTADPTTTAPQEEHKPSEAYTTAQDELKDPRFMKLENTAAEIVAMMNKEAGEDYNMDQKAGLLISGERYGGRLLKNLKFIGTLDLFKIVQMAPKGAHLHIHLNACLGPEVLLDLAASDKLKHNMYISVNLQNETHLQAMIKKNKDDEAKQKAQGVKNPRVRNRTEFGEPLTKENINTAKFQFHFLPHDWDTTCSLFDDNYRGRVGARDSAEDKIYDVMKFADFLEKFDGEIKKGSKDEPESVYKGKHQHRPMNWLIKRLVFQKNDVDFERHEIDPVKRGEPKDIIEGQWAKFDTRTQMMKGLFFAEHAYRVYLQELFSSFNADKIQYAELRPNFMAANSVICTPGENGPYDYKKKMNNSKIMDMIIDEFEKWKGAHPRATFKSMKVIMCTPRSVGYGIENIEATMKECYEMKKNEKYKDWIAGFDFVGPELEGRKLGHEEFTPLFKYWKPRFSAIGLKWLLHCGESVYDEDQNLKFALENLDPYRLAHGYAIPNIKLSTKAWEKLTTTTSKKCAIETCPDSNENLGLAYGASCAVVHKLMKEGIPCSVSGDNPTLFKSTLSHQFLQVMAGRKDFGLLKLRQLMMDSLEYSVWNEVEIEGKVDRTVENEVWNEWRAEYKKFVRHIVATYSFMLTETMEEKDDRQKRRAAQRRKTLGRTASAPTSLQSGKTRTR